jgi:UDP-N-acetylmuramate--alanine ligase
MNIDLNNLKKVFFYGIGGIGISAIARMLLEQGKEVVGQDLNDSENITLLKSLGAAITIGQSLDAIPADTDLIVYSRAYRAYAQPYL